MGRWGGILLAAGLTLVLLEMPVGGLWLVPCALLAWRRSVAGAFIALSLVWAASGVAGVALHGSPQAEVVRNLILRLGTTTVIGTGFLAILWRTRSPSRALLVGVLPWGGLVGVGVLVALLTDPDSVLLWWSSEVMAVIEQVLTAVEKSPSAGAETAEQLAVIREALDTHGAWLFFLLPALLTVSLLLTLWFNLWVIQLLEPGFAGLRLLREWRPPDPLFWGMIVGGVLTLTRWPPLLAPGLNLLIVGGCIYFLSGLAVMGFLGRRLGFPGWLYLPLVAVLLFSGGGLVVVFVGLVDFWLDLRSRWPEQTGVA